MIMLYTDSMTQSEASDHLRERAYAEFNVAKNLFDSNNETMYPAALFHCHLSLELGIKSCFIERYDRAAPFTHDINELASQIRDGWTKEQEDAFDRLSEFAVLARYGDEEWMEKEATKENVKKWLNDTEAFLTIIFS